MSASPLACNAVPSHDVAVVPFLNSRIMVPAPFGRFASAEEIGLKTFLSVVEKCRVAMSRPRLDDRVVPSGIGVRIGGVEHLIEMLAVGLDRGLIRRAEERVEAGPEVVADRLRPEPALRRQRVRPPLVALV